MVPEPRERTIEREVCSIISTYSRITPQWQVAIAIDDFINITRMGKGD